MEPICVQGRTITASELDWLRELISSHPQWHRTALSRHLCEVWNWRNGAGRSKDMAARTLLLKLEGRGLIKLPAPQRRNGNSQRRAQAPSGVQGEFDLCAPLAIEGSLKELQPVSLELVETLEQRRRASRLLEAYHYCGFSGAVGENVQYLARDARGRELAVMIFGAAAWKVADRDRFIGWSAQQRAQHLLYVTNQQRYLILPWVRVRHLASHLLALATRRLSQDWQGRYGHRIWLVETFVERERFAGTSYKAAGWIHLGETTGRTRQDRFNVIQVPIKDIWVQPLSSRFREHLTIL